MNLPKHQSPEWYQSARVEWAFNKLMGGVARFDRSSAYIVCTKSVAEGLEAKLKSLGWTPIVETLKYNGKHLHEEQNDLRSVTVAWDK